MRGPDIRQRPYKPVAQRFWPMVAKSGGCWEWIGATNIHGYGQMSPPPGTIPHRPLAAHRVAWELHYGPIPEGQAVLHRCDNPPCVRPDHLWLGTKADNSRDMANKGRSGATVHPERMPRGTRHGAARLTDAQVADIRTLREQGVPGVELAARYAVSATTISEIQLRRTWRHIP